VETKTQESEKIDAKKNGEKGHVSFKNVVTWETGRGESVTLGARNEGQLWGGTPQGKGGGPGR